MSEIFELCVSWNRRMWPWAQTSYLEILWSYWKFNSCALTHKNKLVSVEAPVKIQEGCKLTTQNAWCAWCRCSAARSGANQNRTERRGEERSGAQATWQRERLSCCVYWSALLPALPLLFCQQFLTSPSHHIKSKLHPLF